jgi:hypothetical protein
METSVILLQYDKFKLYTAPNMETSVTLLLDKFKLCTAPNAETSVTLVCDKFKIHPIASWKHQ